jgi:hypothetical protein
VAIAFFVADSHRHRVFLKIQEHATLLDLETVSLLWLASKEPCEFSEMVGLPQAAL